MSPAPHADHRPTFKLLAPHLSRDDHAKLSVFVRVAGDRLKGDWKIVAEGNGHLLLLDEEHTQTLPGMMDAPLSTLRLSNGSPSEFAQEGILFRPLQYDALIDALLAVERQVLRSEAPEAPDATPAVAPADRVRQELARTVPQAQTPAATSATGELQLGAGDTVRLRRWPTSALLKRHRYNGRLASFLSVRHVGLDDLLRLSNVERPHCVQFLQALHAAGMLDVRRTEAAPAADAPTRRSGSLRADAAASSGLFARIRRHFGIARGSA